MGTQYGPSLVQQGLILCLDPASPKSYPGAGTGWYDVSSTLPYCGLFATTFSGNTNGGVMAFNNVANSYGIQSAGTLGISGSGACTIAYFAKWTGAAFPADYPSAFGNNTVSVVQQGLSTTWRDGRPALDYWNSRWRIATTLNVQQWYHVAFVKTVGSSITGCSSVYVNGQLMAGALENADAISITDSAYVVGRLDNQTPRYWLGFIGPITVYNRALSAAEVNQNLNALRGRFGI